MKKFITVSLTAGLLAIGTSALLADSSTNTPSTSAPTTITPTAPEKGKDPAKRGLARREIMTILGLTKADFKGLTPADRIAKTKSLVDKKISELEAKQTADTITAKEQSDLALLKKFEKHAHAKKKTDS